MRFNVGDRVCVARKAEFIPGSRLSWAPGMDKYVRDGKVYRIRSAEPGCYRLEGDDGRNFMGYLWPPGSLEAADSLEAALIHNQYSNAVTTDGTNFVIKPVTFPIEDVKMELKIEERVFINGSDVTNVTAETMIDLIGKAEAEAEKLSNLKTKSAAITARIESLRAGATRLAALLDAR